MNSLKKLLANATVATVAFAEPASALEDIFGTKPSEAQQYTHRIDEKKMSSSVVITRMPEGSLAIKDRDHPLGSTFKICVLATHSDGTPATSTDVKKACTSLPQNPRESIPEEFLAPMPPG